MAQPQITEFFSVKKRGIRQPEKRRKYDPAAVPEETDYSSAGIRAAKSTDVSEGLAEETTTSKCQTSGISTSLTKSSKNCKPAVEPPATRKGRLRLKARQSSISVSSVRQQSSSRALNARTDAQPTIPWRPAAIDIAKQTSPDGTDQFLDGSHPASAISLRADASSNSTVSATIGADIRRQSLPSIQVAAVRSNRVGTGLRTATSTGQSDTSEDSKITRVIDDGNVLVQPKETGDSCCRPHGSSGLGPRQAVVPSPTAQVAASLPSAYVTAVSSKASSSTAEPLSKLPSTAWTTPVHSCKPTGVELSTKKTHGSAGRKVRTSGEPPCTKEQLASADGVNCKQPPAAVATCSAEDGHQKRQVHTYASEAVAGGLALPSKYRQLEQMFRYCDTIVAILHNRHEIVTFEKLKKGVQQMARKAFLRDTLGQIKTVFPSAYDIKLETLPAAYGQGVSAMVIEPNLGSLNSVGQHAESGKTVGPRDCLQFTADDVVERKLRFKLNLVEIVKQHHEEFLSKLQLPVVTHPGREIRHWHPGFDLEQLPEIPASALPLPKRSETHITAADVFSDKKGYLSPKVQLALAKLQESRALAAQLQERSQLNPTLPQSAASVDLSTGHATSSRTASLTEKAGSLLATLQARKAAAECLLSESNPLPSGIVNAVVAGNSPVTSHAAVCTPSMSRAVTSSLAIGDVAGYSSTSPHYGVNPRVSSSSSTSAPLSKAGSSSSRANALKGVPEWLIEKVRQKEMLNTAVAMVSYPGEEKKIRMLENLREIARIIKTFYLIEKKTTMPLHVVVAQVQASYQSGMSRTSAEEHVRYLIEVAPEFISEVKANAGTYLNVNKNTDPKKIKELVAKALADLRLKIATT